MKASFTAAGVSPSFFPTDPGNHFQVQAWHLYISGTMGAAGSLQVQYSPDGANVTDAAARWFAPAALQASAVGDTWFEARFRRLRFVFTGGDGTTNLVAEVV